MSRAGRLLMAPRSALGLRGRIVGAVIVTAVVTLLVAALALLGPLEQKLRTAELNTFKQQMSTLTNSFRNQGAALDNVMDYYHVALPPLPRGAAPLVRDQFEQARHAQAEAVAQHDALVRTEGFLAEHTQATEMAIVGLNGAGWTVVARYPVEGPALPLGPVAQELHGHGTKPRITTGSSDGSDFARATLPFTTSAEGHRQRWLLVVHEQFAELTAAVHAVRTAFLDAALAALALTLVLAIPLAFRIVRRLRRLRKAALDLAAGSPAQLPLDRGLDEVGDLARAFTLMQKQLNDQEQARRAFVATASHELRTPLTSLEGMLELLEQDLHDETPDLDDARSLLDRARAQSHRLGRLAADLLDLSRIDAQVALRSEPVELGELSRAVLAEFELGTAERAIAAELQDGEGPVWALGDPGSVARILRILLDNAMRVSPPGSEISVRLCGGPEASLSVCDQGPGVPVDEQELIFERFHRGRNTSGQAGFGLGLAIGRELARRMGGDLALEASREPGATFRLTLPMATAPEQDPLSVA